MDAVQLGCVTHVGDGCRQISNATISYQCYIGSLATASFRCSWDVARFRRWAYAQQGWAPIAALAPLVMAAAKAGDAVATRIIDTAADQAAGAVAAVVARCGVTGMGYKIVLSGAPSHRCGVHP